MDISKGRGEAFRVGEQPAYVAVLKYSSEMASPSLKRRQISLCLLTAKWMKLKGTANALRSAAHSAKDNADVIVSVSQW